MWIQAAKKRLLSDQLLVNAGWLGGAEFLSRIFRLAITAVVARHLSSYDYGLLAIVLTTNEISNIFTLRAGIGSKLIQADEEELEALCNTSYWLTWLLCIALFSLQCLLSFPISQFYRNDALILPICAISSVYLLIPFFSIQGALIARENRLKVTALCNFSQSILGNLTALALVLLGMGFWAIVLSIIISNPVWLIINRMSHPWRPSGKFTLHRWREITSFSISIFGVELLNRLRNNLDYLVVGRFLGVDALGLYYFAFNAGLGISLNVITSLSWSLYPHLCEVRHEFEKLRERYFASLKKVALIIVPLVIAQASFSPFYVPILFGQKWTEAVPIVIIICLSAISRPFAEAASMLLQSLGKVNLNLCWDLVFTLILSISLLFSAKMGIQWVALSVLLAHWIVQTIFTLWTTQHVFGRRLFRTQ